MLEKPIVIIDLPKGAVNSMNDFNKAINGLWHAIYEACGLQKVIRQQMPITSHYRGHPIEFRGRAWYFGATSKRMSDDMDISCALCGKPPTPDGHDACLGHIEGVKHACCGHGVEQGYITWTARDN